MCQRSGKFWPCQHAGCEANTTCRDEMFCPAHREDPFDYNDDDEAILR